MIRNMLFAISALTLTLGLGGPAMAQVRGEVATATLSMQCLPNMPSTANIIILATGAQVVPAGTLVTVKYMAPAPGRKPFGASGPIYKQQTVVYRTKHTMHLADPEVVGVQGYCLSATYTSDQPVLAPK